MKRKKGRLQLWSNTTNDHQATQFDIHYPKITNDVTISRLNIHNKQTTTEES